MSKVVEKIEGFIEYVSALKGDEKGEAQVFCDRLFQAFGHEGYNQAGATLEFRVRAKGKRTKYSDLVWQPRLLLEMKSRGEKLERHYEQVFDYWTKIVPGRPRYVVLCNFDEFWIYDFNSQLYEPVDRVLTKELPERYVALNFLFPKEKKPQFGNNRIDVTRAAAAKVAQVFKSLVGRGEGRERAQRFILQCVVAMFSEDFDLLPRGLFTDLLDDCRNGNSTYDLLGDLFRQMGNPALARGGRYKDVQYFNGGLFNVVDPVELDSDELSLLLSAANEKWSKVQPPIFGTLFENSMDEKERHAYGAHFTSEADIQKVIRPTIVWPWRERIETADTLEKLLDLREQLLRFHILDPACGSGNFLYIAYRELKRIERDLLTIIRENYKIYKGKLSISSLVSTQQFYGIDKNPFAIELAKVTLMLAKEVVIKEAADLSGAEQIDLPLQLDKALPLDNLDDNIRHDDALFCEWPRVQAIIGNPPYQSKNKMKKELGSAYVDRVRDRYPDVPGRADYCVYWFRRAQDELPSEGRAGLVGTNTIRQNYSREGGLDYIVQNGGTITEAVSTQVWSGEAVVHVSIVNWVKGAQPGKKRLHKQLGDKKESPWQIIELDHIHSALSGALDLTKAKRLRSNISSKACYQGQTHGDEGFLLTPSKAKEMMSNGNLKTVIHPYLIGDDLLGDPQSLPSRYAIDLNRSRDLISAMKYGKAFKHIEEFVMPVMEAKANKEREDTGKDKGPRQSHFQHWWKFWRGRLEMLNQIAGISRYIACVRVTKRPIFEFIDSAIHPNDALQVFPLPDDYSFGILQSNIHWSWFIERCSTFKGDFRYTSNTVFDTFPWPQSPMLEQIKQVAKSSVMLRQLRRKIMAENGWNLRQLYRTLEVPGKNRLRDAQEALDTAVQAAYGMKRKDNPLDFLLKLNLQLAQQEADKQPIVGPGLPPIVTAQELFITDDSIRMSV